MTDKNYENLKPMDLSEIQEFDCSELKAFNMSDIKALSEIDYLIPEIKLLKQKTCCKPS
jgi:hypothetical protein